MAPVIFCRRHYKILQHLPRLLQHAVVVTLCNVYALVAKRHHTSIQSVERTIRVAIEITWLRGDMDEIMCIFHNTVDGRKARPTNKEFIALIVDYLNIEHM